MSDSPTNDEGELPSEPVGMLPWLGQEFGADVAEAAA